jgi:hypothetical protein
LRRFRVFFFCFLILSKPAMVLFFLNACVAQVPPPPPSWAGPSFEPGLYLAADRRANFLVSPRPD